MRREITTNSDSGGVAIRPFEDRDEATVAAVWHRSGRAAYPFLPTWQAFTLEHAEKVFRDVIRPRCDIWVGTRDERVVAFLALAGSYVDRMYVDPTEWRKGWGTRFRPARQEAASQRVGAAHPPGKSRRATALRTARVQSRQVRAQPAP
jgi:hypothetical protein